MNWIVLIMMYITSINLLKNLLICCQIFLNGKLAFRSQETCTSWLVRKVFCMFCCCFEFFFIDNLHEKHMLVLFLLCFFKLNRKSGYRFNLATKWFKKNSFIDATLRSFKFWMTVCIKQATRVFHCAWWRKCLIIYFWLTGLEIVGFKGFVMTF